MDDDTKPKCCPFCGGAATIMLDDEASCGNALNKDCPGHDICSPIVRWNDRAPERMLAKALEPFALLGGDPDMQAFHDLEDDVVLWENSGRYVTAGDVRRARDVLGACRGEPVYHMHFRRVAAKEE